MQLKYEHFLSLYIHSQINLILHSECVGMIRSCHREYTHWHAKVKHDCAKLDKLVDDDMGSLGVGWRCTHVSVACILHHLTAFTILLLNRNSSNLLKIPHKSSHHLIQTCVKRSRHPFSSSLASTPIHSPCLPLTSTHHHSPDYPPHTLQLTRPTTRHTLLPSSLSILLHTN